MKRILSSVMILAFVMLLCSCAGFMQNSAAKDRTDDLKGLVTKVTNYLSSNGKKATLAQINDPQGIFTYDNLFAFVIATKQNGKVIASADKSLLNANMKTKDENGKAFINDIVKAASAGKNKDGNITYNWNKQAKSGYFKKVGSLIIVGSN
jgi:ferritin